MNDKMCALLGERSFLKKFLNLFTIRDREKSKEEGELEREKDRYL